MVSRVAIQGVFSGATWRMGELYAAVQFDML